VKKKKTHQPSNKLNRTIPYGKTLCVTFLAALMMAAFATQVFAAENTATTVWDKAKEIMQDVYNQILLISTIAAVVTAAVALLLMNFSKNGKTVDESRAWLKRIIISWAVLNGLGFIMAWIVPYFSDGKWTS